MVFYLHIIILYPRIYYIYIYLYYIIVLGRLYIYVIILIYVIHSITHTLTKKLISFKLK